MAFRHEGLDLVVVRYEGRVHAFENACPHRGAPLDQGSIEDGCLVCPLHGWAFTLETAQMQGTSHRLRRIETREEREHVDIKAPRVRPGLGG